MSEVVVNARRLSGVMVGNKACRNSIVIDSSRDPKDLRDQLEMFLFKFPDIARGDITHLLEEFQKHDKRQDGVLEKDEALMLFEHRGEVKTLMQMLTSVGDLDYDSSKGLSFLAWCCCHYKKSWVELHDFSDEGAYEAAMLAVKKAREAADAAKQAIEDAKKREEDAAAARAAELEAESKLTGVQGAACFFKRQMEGVQDETKSNEAKIKEAAASRRRLREAKQATKQAEEDAAKNKAMSPEAVAAKLAEAKAEAERVEQEEKDKTKAEEKARRAEFKKRMQEKFEAGNK